MKPLMKEIIKQNKKLGINLKKVHGYKNIPGVTVYEFDTSKVKCPSKKK